MSERPTFCAQLNVDKCFRCSSKFSLQGYKLFAGRIQRFVCHMFVKLSTLSESRCSVSPCRVGTLGANGTELKEGIMLFAFSLNNIMPYSKKNKESTVVS